MWCDLCIYISTLKVFTIYTGVLFLRFICFYKWQQTFKYISTGFEIDFIEFVLFPSDKKRLEIM